ncbi:hypothetical protein RB195_026078 [Necator americanus]|uniref:Uncharacterized protein n=1 Tax=Necator americanus TaxID=51031 RepID=A0ABR1EV94_NECAM
MDDRLETLITSDVCRTKPVHCVVCAMQNQQPIKRRHEVLRDGRSTKPPVMLEQCHAMRQDSKVLDV